MKNGMSCPRKISDTTTLLRAVNAVDELRGESYDHMAALMNTLLDTAGDDEDHPLSGLLDLISDMVSRYEQKHHAIEPAELKMRCVS